MDFRWEAAQKELYDRALDFGRSIDKASDEGTHDGAFSRHRWSLLGGFGLLGLSVPNDLGGMGLGALMTARLVEAFGRGCTDGGLLFSACAHLFACTMPIVEYGGSELRRSLVPRLARGELVGANGITEAEAGSDVFSLKARATRSGDEYVLDGVKSYVTNGPVADVLLVYAVTDPKLGYFGLSAFAVEKSAPGLIVGEPFTKIGLHSALTSTVYLDGCRVPASHRLGDEGQGAPIFKSSMAWERACLFAGYLGAMERDVERSVSFAKERSQFGRAIGKNQAVSHRIVDMKLRLEAARLLLYRACWLKDAGESPTLEISLAKLAVSEAAIRSGLDVIQVHGGLGVTVNTGLADSLLNALPSTVFSGTSEMQREIIARELGL